jgi:hypothetical protein
MSNCGKPVRKANQEKSRSDKDFERAVFLIKIFRRKFLIVIFFLFIQKKLPATFNCAPAINTVREKILRIKKLNYKILLKA